MESSLLSYEDLFTTLFSLLKGEKITSLFEKTERLYFSGTDFTINLIPAALVGVALVGCEYV